MTTTVRWLGHSAFALTIDGHAVLIDPFLQGTRTANADDLDAEVILLSHGHGDHVGDTVSIAQRTDALVVSNPEIAAWLGKQGLSRTHGQNSGGGWDYGFMHVKFTHALHSSGLPDGSYGGNPHGFIITPGSGSPRLYFAGDTALFSDMALYGEEGLDVAFLPIGDNFTMGPDDAVRALGLLKPKRVIPMHYNTFPPIQQDAEAFAAAVRARTTVQPLLLPLGETVTL